MVMGNKSQMLWDIPPMDSFRVLGEIYGVPANEFKRNLDELVSLLEIKEVLTKPVRNLSLGERMKCELAASLLHRPQVLFLDEPDTGDGRIDAAAPAPFFGRLQPVSGATMILTSHYMADVVALCSRVVLIHHGRLLHDGALSYLAKGMIPFKMLRITLGAEQISQADLPALPDGAEVISIEENVLNLRIPHAKAASITTWLLKEMDVVDLTVEEPAIESVIDQVYREVSVNRGGWALIRSTWLSWMQYSSFFFILAFGWMIPPLIYLFVWSVAAGEGQPRRHEPR
jgi:ABC-2 type transport system ATP-binding protein